MVHGNYDVGGRTLAQHFADDALELIDGVVRRQARADAGGRRRERLEVAIDAIAQRVVGHQLLMGDAAGGRADQVEHGKAVRLAAHDAIQRTELAHAIGGAEDGRALAPGIAVCGVGGIELIGAGNPRQRRARLDCIVDGEGIIAGYAEGSVDAELGETLDGVFCDGGV